MIAIVVVAVWVQLFSLYHAVSTVLASLSYGTRTLSCGRGRQILEERTHGYVWCSGFTSLNPTGRCCHCRLRPFLWSAVSVNFRATHTQTFIQTNTHTGKTHMWHVSTQTLPHAFKCAFIEKETAHTHSAITGSHPVPQMIILFPLHICISPSPAFSSRATPGWEVQPDQLSGQWRRRDGHHWEQLLPGVQGHLLGERPW